MKPEDVRILEQHRLHEAREALKDADCLRRFRVCGGDFIEKRSDPC